MSLAWGFKYDTQLAAPDLWLVQAIIGSSKTVIAVPAATSKPLGGIYQVAVMAPTWDFGEQHQQALVFRAFSYSHQHF